MMHQENILFEKKIPQWDAFEEYGFYKKDNAYLYETDFMNGDFHAIITVTASGEVYGNVIDLMTDEEYLPIWAPSQTGSFVSSVRYAYQELLKDIGNKCFLTLPFASDQSNRLAAYIAQKYHNQPEFPWTGSNSEIAVFRHTDSRKWYGIIMPITLDKLTKDASHQEMKIEVLNLKIHENERDYLHTIDGIYPAWHMNHKSWISIILNDTLEDEQLFSLLDESYQLTDKGGPARKDMQKKVWVIPSNPKYYDVVSEFDKTDYATWKQGKGIEAGDIVYLYVGAPYSAIMYRMEVTKTHIPYHGTTEFASRIKEIMDVHILDRYPKELCSRTGMMMEHGVKSVRGPRYMPEELIAAIDAASERH